MSDLISIEKTADMLGISVDGVKTLIKKGLVKTQNNQVIRQSVLDLIDMRDDALSKDDIFKYTQFSESKFYYVIRNCLFPSHDFKIGKISYWKVETVRGYL